ncbi:MAG: caspase family protein [Pseudomonadota bacterium]
MIRALPLCLALTAAPLQAAETYGLVIGIDAYDHVTDLQGAVNDARDIADALTSIGAEVTLLLDADATRAAVLDSWQATLNKAAPGDTLIVTYAGHGSNEPEHTPGNEVDGRDENFLLAGFAPYGTAAGERIRDDEIADLIAQRPDVSVIFVADACHSGTVTRNLNPTLGYRYVSPTEIDGDPLPPPPPRPSETADQTEVALFLAAVNEAQKVPEYLIDGEPRGALSFAFAEGLRGAADANNDQVLTKGELETHIRKTVRQVSQGVQLPQAAPAGAVNTQLIALPASYTPPQDIRDRPLAALPPISLATAASLPPLPTISPTAPLQPAAARYDASTGQVTSMVGDVIATVDGPEALSPVATKMQVAAAISETATSALSVQFADGDKAYRNGETLTVQIANRTTPHLTLINIASTGEIALLYPLTAAGDPLTVAPTDTLSLPLRVQAPFGSDHIVALESARDPSALRLRLRDLNGSKDMAALWDIIRTDDSLTTAVFPFFTRGAP